MCVFRKCISRRNEVNECSVEPVEVPVQLQFEEHEQETDANECETWKTQNIVAGVTETRPKQVANIARLQEYVESLEAGITHVHEGIEYNEVFLATITDQQYCADVYFSSACQTNDRLFTRVMCLGREDPLQSPTCCRNMPESQLTRLLIQVFKGSSGRLVFMFLVC